jgi:predicted AlkP superfamily pyrophosphatase or phosphodiesterase
MEHRPLALILVDGMRPDGLLQAQVPTLKRLMAEGAHSLSARTVLPSLTLPCITAMMLGVSPQVHGTLTNRFASQAWDGPGLIDLLHAAGYKTATFTNWEQLRDLSQPGSLDLSICLNTSESYSLPIGESDERLVTMTISALYSQPMDFIFLYLGCVDTAGHKYGWMSPEYIRTIENADRCIEHFLSELPANTTVIVTADHGGVGYSHGFDSDEELFIPFIIHNAGLIHGDIQRPVSILDIAPTIAAYFGISVPTGWEGISLLS